MHDFQFKAAVYYLWRITKVDQTPRQMQILILNGPNLNLLGSREPEVYGAEGFDACMQSLGEAFPEVDFAYAQSNVEGELINTLQAADGKFSGVELNAGGYTHTSVALGDAIKAIAVPVVEVHISNVFDRETFRHVSMLAAGCIGSISGFGLDSYHLGVEALLRKAN